MKITEEDFGALAICAIRYCQGRETYMPSLIRGIVRGHISEVTDKDLQVMINDCESQALWGDYGSDYDKQGWLAWKEFLLAEQQRRKNDIPIPNDCDKCLNSRVVYSENGSHSVCTLSEMKMKECIANNRSNKVVIKLGSEGDKNDD